MHTEGRSSCLCRQCKDDSVHLHWQAETLASYFRTQAPPQQSHTIICSASCDSSTAVAGCGGSHLLPGAIVHHASSAGKLWQHPSAGHPPVVNKAAVDDPQGRLGAGVACHCRFHRRARILAHPPHAAGVRRCPGCIARSQEGLACAPIPPECGFGDQWTACRRRVEQRALATRSCAAPQRNVRE